MKTEQEKNLMETASRSNIWVSRYPSIKAHLIAVLSDWRVRYFTDTDGTTTASYPAFFANVLRAHNDLYADSLPCLALGDDAQLREHQKAVKLYRDFDRYLVQNGDLYFNIRGWGSEQNQGIIIESIKVRKGTRSATWNTRDLSYLPEKLGFDRIQKIVTGITEDDPRYNEIRNVLRNELAKGWTGEESATWMAPVRALAVSCRPLDATLNKYLPDVSNKDRADLILQLFGLNDYPRYIDPKRFAEWLNPPKDKRK